MAAGFAGVYMIVWAVVSLVALLVLKGERPDLHVHLSAISGGLLSAAVWAASTNLFSPQ